MRAAALSALAFLVSTGDVCAGTNRQAKEKLEALKKQLPTVLKAWSKSHPPAKDYLPALRRVRATGNATAKIVIGLHYEGEGGQFDDPTFLLTVFLKYHDGLWTTVRFEWSRSPGPGSDPCTEPAHFLLDAIDQAAEK
jgi:hypothetical protein